MSTEIMSYDVVIVGAGPAGLAAAIHLKTLANLHNESISICVLEKGSEVGAHLLSGAVLEPSSLMELLPNTWQKAPLDTPAIEDEFIFLTQKHHFRLPTPKPFKNDGNYIISLGALGRFLAQEAQDLGVEIYPGFPATDFIYQPDGQISGVITGVFGIDKNGLKTQHYQEGMHIRAKYTLLAEGCRGQLTEQVIKQFKLRAHSEPQTYGLGIKEIWEVKSNRYLPGRVTHTIGWPLDHRTYGGSFIYHLSQQRVAIGFVVGLDYQNPYLSPFEEMQRFKTHPFVRPLLEGGERIAYGARALNEGGLQSLPKLVFPGGAIIGDAAGFLNVAKIKGIHNAIHSGMLAAKACIDALFLNENKALELNLYSTLFKDSSMHRELFDIRNIRPGFRKGLWTGLANAAFETYVTKGKSPWTLSQHADHTTLKPAKQCKKIDYPKPDGQLTFDRLSSVFLTNTYHEENQPAHLVLKNPDLAIDVNYKTFDSPETRYCPAAVYEILTEGDTVRLQINAQNCIHCKTCDIKDPRQNIHWQAPEGGGGPNYSSM